MKLKICFLLISAVIIGYIIHSTSVFIETAESKIDSEAELADSSEADPGGETSVSGEASPGDKPNAQGSGISEKEDFADKIFFEIRYVDSPEEKAELYRKVVDVCKGSVPAQEALWRLSLLYLNDFDEPNVKEAIACLEQFLKLYPDSEWRQHVEFSLVGLYENEKSWKKVITLCEKILADNPNMPGSQREELLKKHNAARIK